MIDRARNENAFIEARSKSYVARERRKAEEANRRQVMAETKLQDKLKAEEEERISIMGLPINARPQYLDNRKKQLLSVRKNVAIYAQNHRCECPFYVESNSGLHGLEIPNVTDQGHS